MLPATFAHEEDLRASSQALGIFAVAILAAGFSFTGLLAFAVRDPRFLQDAVYVPAITSCVAGLLTIFYDFIISERYYWNVPAFLSTAIAVLSILAYAALLLYAARRQRLKTFRPPVESALPSPHPGSVSTEGLMPRYQDSGYYANYIQNMFPASVTSSSQPRAPGAESISEEEMQRQQMLMLLRQNTPAPASNASQSTFRIDWQDTEQDDVSPLQGYAASGAHTQSFGSSGFPMSSVSRSWTSRSLQPWDGVWRDPMPASMRAPPRVQASNRQARDEIRQRIESGY